MRITTEHLQSGTTTANTVSIAGLENITDMLTRFKNAPTPTPQPVSTIDIDEERPSYDAARTFTDLRQTYLDNLNLGPMRAKIASIKYVFREDPMCGLRGGTLMSTSRDATGDIHIVVSNRAFDAEKEDDFLSTLIDHEFVHVDDYLDPAKKNIWEMRERLIERFTKEFDYQPHTRRRDDNELKVAQYMLELSKILLEVPVYTHQLTAGIYSSHLSSAKVASTQDTLYGFRHFADVVRKITDIHPRDLLRNPDGVYETLKKNVDAIDEALREPQT